MSAVSDRARFLEEIIHNPMTIDEIVKKYNVVANTARNWVKYDEVEKIPGSYPHAFRRKDTGIIPQSGARPVSKATTENVVILPNVPESQVKAFFEKVMGDEAPPFNFNDEFRQIDGGKSLETLMNKLKTCMVVTKYYHDLMEKDGLL